MPTTIPLTYPSNQGGLLAPPGYSVQQNVQNAQNYAANHSTAENYLWFYNQVKPGGPWDYKAGGNSEYQGIGNWNFGAVGAGMLYAFVSVN
jgi:hypothetical protein